MGFRDNAFKIPAIYFNCEFHSVLTLFYDLREFHRQKHEKHGNTHGKTQNKRLNSIYIFLILFLVNTPMPWQENLWVIKLHVFYLPSNGRLGPYA